MNVKGRVWLGIVCRGVFDGVPPIYIRVISHEKVVVPYTLPLLYFTMF